jgi:uncharacterized protein (TIGR02246 family)
MLGAIEDYEEVRQLNARYCHLLDAHDATGWAALFSEDGVLDLGGTKTQGTEALQAYVEGLRAGHRGYPVRHLVTNVVIDVYGDVATSQSYVVLLSPGGPGLIAMMGRYNDQLRRIDGHWRLQERRLDFDPTPPGLRAIVRQLPGMAYRTVKVRYQRALQPVRRNRHFLIDP